MKKKIITILGSATAIFIGLLVFIILPLLKDVEENYKDLQVQKNSLQAYQAQEKTYADLKDRYIGTKNGFDELFIDASAPVEIIGFWEKMASDTNVYIEISANNFKGKDEKLWDYSDFQIKITGSFANSLKFIKKLENEPYAGEIMTFSMKNKIQEGAKNDAKQSSGNLQTNISLRVYAKSQ